MRDIGFRGRDAKENKWHYGYLDATMYKDIVVIHTTDSTYEINPDTVGEFTGLCDANGKPIYEGDIIACGDEPFGIVIWHANGYFCINDDFDLKQRNYAPIGDLFEWRHIRDKGNIFSVIGNIHDNPEMLKGGDNAKTNN